MTSIFVRASTIMIALSICCLLEIGNSSSVDAATFRGLGLLPEGWEFWDNPLISGDGTVIAGTLGNGTTTQAFRWTETGGFELIDNPPNTISIFSVSGLSADGSVLVGTKTDFIRGLANPQPRPYRWVADGGWMTLSSDRSFAYDTSSDGSIVVGGIGQSNFNLFRWTAEEGVSIMGSLEQGTGGRVRLSGDGSVVAGTRLVSCSDSRCDEAFRWTAETGIVSLGNLSGGEYPDALATAISANGKVIFGNTTALGGRTAYRWTEETGMVPLPFSGRIEPRAVSEDGTVLTVGNWIWDLVNGARPLEEALVLEYDLGLQMAGWEDVWASDISDDGRTILGLGTNPNGLPEAWIAFLDPITIPEPTSLQLSCVFIFGLYICQTRLQSSAYRD